MQTLPSFPRNALGAGKRKGAQSGAGRLEAERDLGSQDAALGALRAASLLFKFFLFLFLDLKRVGPIFCNIDQP